MNLMDMLEQVGGGQSLKNIGGDLGLDSSSTSALVAALAPALMKGMQNQTASADGLSALEGALASGNHQQYIENPESMLTSEARTDGNNILGHLFGSKDVSRNVAAQAAETTGIDSSLIKKALPLLAGLAMGAVSKNSSSTSGDSLSGLLGGLLGGSDGDMGMDDVLNLAKKFF